ncbi:hypothetical protein SEVIR_5G206500v4 [Setaria viridis]|nr:uncharacterized protein LOC101773549 [Setaria italica]XP_034597971.1 uncharacterized protein LOC117858923 [Setaria viridis]
MKGPVEVTLTRDTPSARRCWWRRDDDLVDDGDVGVLRIGRGLAAVDTTFSSTDEVTKRWLAEASAAARGRHLRKPFLAGLVALRGLDPADRDNYRGRGRGGFKPTDHANPIRCVALCLGGSRALVYSPDTHGYRVRKPAYAGDLLKFYDNNMTQLRAFLDDNRITVACFGAREVTRKLAKEWGLHVAWPEELTDLFARAYGKVAGVEREERLLPKKPEKYWMGKAALKREKAKAERDEYDTDEEERLNNLGRTLRPRKVVSGLSLERMARVALGPEMRLARCPPKVAHADWGSYYLGEEEWAYATRDAYLCFEIAARCFEKLLEPNAAGSSSSSAKPAVATVGMVRPAAVLSH